MNKPRVAPSSFGFLNSLQQNFSEKQTLFHLCFVMIGYSLMLSGHSLLFVTSLRPHPQPKVYLRDVQHGLGLIRAVRTPSQSSHL